MDRNVEIITDNKGKKLVRINEIRFKPALNFYQLSHQNYIKSIFINFFSNNDKRLIKISEYLYILDSIILLF